MVRSALQDYTPEGKGPAGLELIRGFWGDVVTSSRLQGFINFLVSIYDYL